MTKEAFMKLIKETEDAANEIITASEAEKKERISDIQECNRAIKSAESAMNTAVISGDLEAYRKADQEKRFSEERKEIFEKRLEQLNVGILMPANEYNNTVSAILTGYEEVEEEAKNRLVKLAKEMWTIAEELQQETDKANAILNTLQVGVFRNSDRKMGKNGAYIYNDEKEVDIKKGVVAFGKMAAQSTLYKSFTGTVLN